MKIKVDDRSLYKAVNCLETECKYRKSCANHTTAGDFRSESGFKPELRISDGDVYCDTINRLSLDIGYEILPDNHKSLLNGLVLWDDLNEMDSNCWMI